LHKIEEEDHRKEDVFIKQTRCHKNSEKKKEMVKQGRIRRRGKMEPRLEFCLAEEQKAPRAFQFHWHFSTLSLPFQFSRWKVPTLYSRRVFKSAPDLSPKLFSSLTLKQNERWKRRALATERVDP
jgi:hypothetical protein